MSGIFVNTRNESVGKQNDCFRSIGVLNSLWHCFPCISVRYDNRWVNVLVGVFFRGHMVATTEDTNRNINKQLKAFLILTWKRILVFSGYTKVCKIICKRYISKIKFSTILKKYPLFG